MFIGRGFALTLYLVSINTDIGTGANICIDNVNNTGHQPSYLYNSIRHLFIYLSIIKKKLKVFQLKLLFLILH